MHHTDAASTCFTSICGNAPLPRGSGSLWGDLPRPRTALLVGREPRGRADKGTFDLGELKAVHEGATTDALTKKSLVRKAPDPERCFTVVGRTRNVDLECRTKAERDSWVAGLRGLVSHRKANKIH